MIAINLNSILGAGFKNRTQLGGPGIIWHVSHAFAGRFDDGDFMASSAIRLVERSPQELLFTTTHELSELYIAADRTLGAGVPTHAEAWLGFIGVEFSELSYLEVEHTNVLGTATLFASAVRVYFERTP